jgi:hypothetical protein
MKARRSSINRRAFLHLAGSAGFALPFLEGLPERSAFAQSDNARFGLFICTGNGVVQQWNEEPERFWPTQTGALTTESMNAFADERCTGLLAEHADKLLIVRGVNYANRFTGCGHAAGLAECLTAATLTGSNADIMPQGISADTLIAQELNPAGVEPLTLYSGLKQGYIDEKLSFSAAGQVRAAESNPYNVYQRLTGLLDTGGATTTGGPSMADQLALRRASVNDLVREEMESLLARPNLSQADRDRLDLHLTSIRDLEVGMTGMAEACSDVNLDITAIEALNSGTAFRQDGVIEEVALLQAELAALAFSCNATRVATLQAGDGTEQTHYEINGQKVERFHWISHRVQSDGGSGVAIPEALEWHTEIDRIRMRTFKSMIDRWALYSTPNGPLLDNGFMYWTNSISIGPAHSGQNIPVIIAGNAGGYLKNGQYIDAGGVRHDKLLSTLITANGLPTDNFGGGNNEGGRVTQMEA